MEWTDLDLLLKLLFSHLVVDFLLQTKLPCQEKERRELPVSRHS